MIYYAKITKQEDQKFLVEFPDLEGCFTEGDTLDDAILNAHEVLKGWLLSLQDLSKKIPAAKTSRGLLQSFC